MTYIIGIDPGKSLGIAVMDFPNLVGVYQGDVGFGIVYLKDTLSSITDGTNIVYVALEKFIVTPGTGRRPGASQTSALVGKLDNIAKEYAIKGVYLQSVSDASRFSNDLLRKLKLYVCPAQVGCKDSNDANSAVRHILLCLARNRADLFTKLIGDTEL